MKVTRPRVMVGTVGPKAPSSRPRAFSASARRRETAGSSTVGAAPSSPPAFAGSLESDSSKGIDSSVKLSSMDSRAPRSGMANSTA